MKEQQRTKASDLQVLTHKYASDINHVFTFSFNCVNLKLFESLNIIYHTTKQITCDNPHDNQHLSQYNVNKYKRSASDGSNVHE